jgi:hypothetical protein
MQSVRVASIPSQNVAVKAIGITQAAGTMVLKGLLELI